MRIGFRLGLVAQVLGLCFYCTDHSFSSKAERKKLEVRFEDQYSVHRAPPLARFLEDGKRLVVAKSISNSKGFTTWEFRIIGLETGNIVSKTELHDARAEGCDEASARMEVARQEGQSIVIFSICKGQTLALTVPRLAETRAPEGFTLEWPLFQNKRFISERGPNGRVLALSLVDSMSRSQICRLMAPEFQRGDVSPSLNGVTISPNGKMIALFFTFAKPDPPGRKAFAEGIGLRVFDISDCTLLASHIFGVGSGIAPDSGSMFAGPSWPWLVGGSPFKIDKSSVIEIWDWRTGKRIGEIRHARGVGALMDVSRDGRYLIGRIDDDPETSPRNMQDFGVWDIDNRELVCESPSFPKKELLTKLGARNFGSKSKDNDKSTLNYTIDWVEDVKFSPNGDFILHVSAGKIKVYSFRTVN